MRLHFASADSEVGAWGCRSKNAISLVTTLPMTTTPKRLQKYAHTLSQSAYAHAHPRVESSVRETTVPRRFSAFPLRILHRMTALLP